MNFVLNKTGNNTRAGEPMPCGTTGTCYTTTVTQCNVQLGDKKLSGTLSERNYNCIKHNNSQKFS